MMRVRSLALLVASGLIVPLIDACSGSGDSPFEDQPLADGGPDGTTSAGGASASSGGKNGSGGNNGSSGGSSAGGAGGTTPVIDGGGLDAASGGAVSSGGTSGNTGGAATGDASAGDSAAGGTASAGGAVGAGGGGVVGECAIAGDCVTLYGAAVCGKQWSCVSTACQSFDTPGCIDVDGDGYGVGASCSACTGQDCDDADGAMHDTGNRSCYSGKAGTSGVGTCRAGQQACGAGVWGPCVGEVIPSGEACNGLDDDCDTQKDNGLPQFTCGIGACKNSVSSCTGGGVIAVCTPGSPASLVDGPACNGVDDDCDGAIDEDCTQCVPVSDGTGNDSTADGTFLLPFKTVQAAIDWAAANSQTRVCVAAGAACAQNATYQSPSGQTITMSNGVSVYGRYESTTWLRCGTSVTTLQPRTAAGVTFPSSVTATTVLDGFTIDRSNAGDPTSAVTVDGGTNVILSDVTILSSPTATQTYGVNVVNGGSATITRSRIAAGTGTAQAIGVRSVGSQVTVRNNCATLDAAGHCTAGCSNGANPSILGRLVAGPGETFAVLLDDSPGSSVEQSALCGANAADGAEVRVRGDGTGIVIRANTINAFGGTQNSYGVWLTDCNDAAPWIVDNQGITANGTTANGHVDGIRSVGACHPVIDSNVRITGGSEGQTASPNGVYCAANAQGVASRCVVLGNLLIQGSAGGFPPLSTGVRCDDGGCMRIAGNVITGRGGTTTVGVWLGKSGTFVDDNQITGGCGPTALGVRAEDSYARLQNNRIFGFSSATCNGLSTTLQQSWGLRALVASGPNELDVHSNDIDGTGSPNACTSGAVELDATTPAPITNVGIFRNNILRGGVCQTARYGFREATDAADPRFFEHNDVDPTGSPTALYQDSGNGAVTTAAGVDALTDMTVSGTLSVDPLFTTYPTDLHLQAGSLCIGAGTATGAPALDMDGVARDSSPDIGADEH